MGLDDVTRRVLSLRRNWQEETLGNPTILHLPTEDADAVWRYYRQQIPEDEVKRLEARPEHPVDGGTLYGMTVQVTDGVMAVDGKVTVRI